MITYIVIWYILGFIGCCLAAYTDNKRGENILLTDLFLAIIVSVLGIITLMLAVGHFSKYNLTNVVLVKGKK